MNVGQKTTPTIDIRELARQRSTKQGWSGKNVSSNASRFSSSDDSSDDKRQRSTKQGWSGKQFSSKASRSSSSSDDSSDDK